MMTLRQTGFALPTAAAQVTRLLVSPVLRRRFSHTLQRHKSVYLNKRSLAQLRNHTSSLLPALYNKVSFSTKRKMATVLTESERESQLKPLLNEGWKMVDGRDAINKTFQFKNFIEAWCWMSNVAMSGEKMNHHPEWFNVYNKVEVTWATHECSGLSARDIKMANVCEETYKLYK